MLVGFRREYGLDWREAKATMWHVDLALLVYDLPTFKGETWSDTEENLARLVDVLSYWLTSEYAQWVTDPDDPEVKAAREERKRLGIKPPPTPVIFPAAKRPLELHISMLEEALAKQENAAKPHKRAGLDGDAGANPKKKRITIAELQAMRGK